ncbi:MAG: hypothetical protein ACO1Q7_02155 [Gemmatimonas sp.]
MVDFPSPTDNGILTRVSQCLHHFRASDRLLKTVSGVEAEFSRAATSTVDVDNVNWGTIALGYHQPSFEPKSFYIAGQTQKAMSLRLGSNDRLRFPALFLPQPFGFFFEFLHGTPASGEVLVSISNNAATGARWWISWSGGYWRVNYHNGTTSTSATLAVAPINGQTVQLWGYFTEISGNNSVQIFQSINGGASTSALSSAIAGYFGWGSGYDSDIKLRYSHIGNTAGALAWHRIGKLIPTAPSYAQLVRTF